MARPSEPLISRERIADAALAVATSHGRFTMREIAVHLGVQQASLYGHVRSKEEVLDLVRQRVHEEMALRVDLAGEWHAVFREVAIGHRRLLLRYPWLLESIAESPAALGPALSTVENLAWVLHRAGFPDTDIAQIIGALDVLVIGGAVDQLAPEQLYPPSVLQETASLRVAIEAAGPDPRAERVFMFMLDLLIEGLERRLAVTRPAREPRSGSSSS